MGPLFGSSSATTPDDSAKLAATRTNRFRMRFPPISMGRHSSRCRLADHALFQRDKQAAAASLRAQRAHEGFHGARVELKQRFSAEYRKSVHTRRGHP